MPVQPSRQWKQRVQRFQDLCSELEIPTTNQNYRDFCKGIGYFTHDAIKNRLQTLAFDAEVAHQVENLMEDPELYGHSAKTIKDLAIGLAQAKFGVIKKA